MEKRNVGENEKGLPNRSPPLPRWPRRPPACYRLSALARGSFETRTLVGGQPRHILPGLSVYVRDHRATTARRRCWRHFRSAKSSNLTTRRPAGSRTSGGHLLLVVNPVRGPLASPFFFFTGARNELQSPPSIDRDGGPRTRSKDNSVQNGLCRLRDNRFQGWSCCGCGRQCNDRGQSGSFDHGTHGTRPSSGLHQVVVLGPTQRSWLCDFCFFWVTAKIFRRNLTWRSNTAGTTSWCAGRRRWCVFSLGRGASKRNITRAPQPPPVDSNVELCSITPSTC